MKNPKASCNDSRFWLWAACAIVSAAGAAESEPTAAKPLARMELTDVFVGGKEEFHTYRIPAILSAKSGAVLAFAEGRAGRRDQSQNKIVLKRSVDQGVTWSALEVIADGGARSFNNPCAVVEQATGRIFLVFQSYPEGLHERDKELEPGLEGGRIVRNWILQSDDEGKSWSQPRDITRTTKRAKSVTTLASGPGIGIQLRHGPHAGRLVIPFNEGPYGKWRVFAVYSDDRGQTWQLGEPTSDRDAGTVNEVQMVELTNGTIRFNARGWGTNGLRRTAVSRDGGRTWPDIRDVPELREPSCMAALLRVGDATGGTRSPIVYSGPFGRGRTNGTVHLSYDEGETWPVKKTIYAGRFAYSGLVALPGGNLGCLFERGEKDPYERITLARFSLEWLTDGRKP